MSTRDRSVVSRNSELEVNSGHRYIYREMIPYSIRVKTVTPLVFSGVNVNISVYRWTSVMEHIFCDERVPYSICVKIVVRFLTRHATQWWYCQKYHPESYRWE